MNRETALEFVRSRVQSENLLKHMIEVEACMRAVARLLGEDVELWGTVGLLHDVAFEHNRQPISAHGIAAASLLEPLGLPPQVIRAIVAHCDQPKAESLLDRAMLLCDPLAGTIVSLALDSPDKKLASVPVSAVLDRFNEMWGSRPEYTGHIAYLESLGLPLRNMVKSCLNALIDISDELGL